MKKTIIIIATLLIFVSTLVLGKYFDSLYRKEKLSAMELRIFPMEKNFIETDEVRKMIRINDSTLQNINVVDLEKNLEKNEYIGNAEVYKDLNGRVYAEIEQYQPIARILGNKSYYIDISGEKKPLSQHYTEHVVLVFGELESDNKKPIIDLIKKINNDNILKDIISEIHSNGKNLWLKTVNLSAKIKIDLYQNVDHQLNKLKIIYAYLTKNQLENKYQNIDLRYENQAVCK